MSYNRILIKKKLKEFLEEDCRYMDVSSKFIPETSISLAKIISKSKGFVSGLEELKILYDMLKVDIAFKKKDGDKLKKGDIVAELKGNTRSILMGERVGLNLLTHMSSITSTVKKFVEIIEASGKNVKIACTIKTITKLRIF